MSYFFDADYYGDARHARELGPGVKRDKYVAGESVCVWGGGVDDDWGGRFDGMLGRHHAFLLRVRRFACGARVRLAVTTQHLRKGSDGGDKSPYVREGRPRTMLRLCSREF